MMGRISRFMALSFPFALLAGCGTTENGTGGANIGDSSAPVSAAAIFEVKPGSSTAGTVKFIQTEDGVLIAAVLSGLPPGKHGIHLHEKGDCSEPDFSSAGAHFNPTNQPHACPPDKDRHAGDFGNIDVDADGTGRFKLTTDLLTIDDGPSSVVGKAVILHDMADDCMTQPTGGSGTRLSCAVVVK